jgi:hypothetical protein
LQQEVVVDECARHNVVIQSMIAAGARLKLREPSAGAHAIPILVDASAAR